MPTLDLVWTVCIDCTVNPIEPIMYWPREWSTSIGALLLAGVLWGKLYNHVSLNFVHLFQTLLHIVELQAGP